MEKYEVFIKELDEAINSIFDKHFKKAQGNR